MQNYGIGSRSVRRFDNGATPELLDYLDLAEPADDEIKGELLPDGVAENQGRPLLFFVNESRLANSTSEQRTNSLNRLRRNLACRGERTYLAVIRPGSLEVVPVSLRTDSPAWKIYESGTTKALTFFSRLALGHIDEDERPDDADFVFKEMLNLLNQGIDRIAHQIGWADVLSLVGRALFFRFLCDRHIVNESNLKGIAPQARHLKECFDNAQNAHDTCRWLDDTFNGDFLQLSRNGNREFFDYIAERSTTAFSHLKAILRGDEPVGSEEYQTRLPLRWSDFNFAHIPVGLLSQVYEAFCWKWEPQPAEEMSVHYTPRHIAATLVDEVFDSLPQAHESRVLDGACGAGIFLVLAFRRIYGEQWKATGVRPGTKEIRKILEQQLTGFDISESALKLSALSLYLTAIELDPEPIPPSKLGFKKLRQRVLFDHRRHDDPPEGLVVGSLGPHVNGQFTGKYDVVIGNPPWTPLKKKHKKLALQLDTESRAIVSRKDAALGKKYENPDSVPDLPFVWKATEWCKPDGRIAMALPARTLFKQRSKSVYVRKALFRLLEITGIINCSNLRKTHVWPDMDQPFMLLFARNRRPKSGHSIHFISPHADNRLGCLGEMRIDSESAHLLRVESVIEEPWLLKSLAVGTPLDAEIIRKIMTVGTSLEKYWQDKLKLSCSNGYQIKPKQTQRDARPLKVLPDLNRTDLFRFVVDIRRLDKFSRDKVCWPRIHKRDTDKLRVYRAPLTLIQASPGLNRKEGRALLSLADVAYNESFYGYSANGHPDSKRLCRYLHLFVHSNLLLHYTLMTSAEIGVERPKFQKQDFDDCPMVPFDDLTNGQREEIENLSKRLIAEDDRVFADIDAFFGKLYGLDERDMQVIRDTLEVRDPNDELGQRGSKPPTPGEIEKFRRRLESGLRPFFKVLDKEPEVELWNPVADGEENPTAFGVLLVGEKDRELSGQDSIFRSKVLPLANETGATRVVETLSGGLLVGILRQYRYWTPSRARLLGAEIVREHFGGFEG
ncbi:MAG: class I SAM-dependent DNA methyltransferase [Limisphaerales bacterium]